MIIDPAIDCIGRPKLTEINFPGFGIEISLIYIYKIGIYRKSQTVPDGVGDIENYRRIELW